jgi:hypothetical protein
MATFEEYRDLAHFLRNYARAPKATTRSDQILALASHFESLAIAAERSESGEGGDRVFEAHA